MDRDFNQVYISPVLETYFGDGFRKKWNLKKYHDKNSPCVFVGLYRPKDIQTFLNHNSYRILNWGGGDMLPKQLNLVSNLINDGRTFTHAYPGFFSNLLKKHKIKHKKIYISYKSYSCFEPNVLGDKIYIYKGIHGDKSEYYKWDKIINPLIDSFGEKSIIYTDHTSIDDLKKNYYDKSFVYVKPNERGGCTTMFELGHMGRKTIGIGHEGLPNFIKYNDIDDMIKKIELEKINIGKIMEDVSEKTKKIFTNEEWLNLNFW